MKVTERTIAEIARLSLNPIMERLSERARQEMAENFCKPKCGHSPEGSFCPDACIISTAGNVSNETIRKYIEAQSRK